MGANRQDFTFRSYAPSPWNLSREMARRMRNLGLRGGSPTLCRSRPDRPRRDLETHLREGWPEDHPVLEDLARFGDAAHGRASERLDLCCLVDDREIVVAVSTYRAAQIVRRNDRFLGGVVFTGDLEQGDCRVRPRIVRVVCSNGCVVPTSQIDEAGEYVREAGVPPLSDLAEAVAAGLSGRIVDAAAETLRTAADLRIRDPIEALREHLIRVPRPRERTVRQAFRQERDPTLFGAFNALTRTARDAPDPRERFALERLAGLLLTADLREDAAVPV